MALFYILGCPSCNRLSAVAVQSKSQVKRTKVLLNSICPRCEERKPIILDLVTQHNMSPAEVAKLWKLSHE